MLPRTLRQPATVIRHARVDLSKLKNSHVHPVCQWRWNSSSTDDAAEQTVAADRDDTLPFLQRPLGIADPPSTARMTWAERTQEIMDQDVRLARRRHIIKEAAKGYYSDFHALRKFGGKSWIGPPSLIREENALYFPDVAGVPLTSKEQTHTTTLCAGKISIVAMLSTKISEEHVDSFVRPSNDAFLSDPRYRFVQINLQENTMKAFLVSFYLSSLRRAVPKPLHDTYLLSTQNMEYLREPLGMTNKHIGFVYLLDQHLRVRWAGGGVARSEESASLRNCVRVLLDRLPLPTSHKSEK